MRFFFSFVGISILVCVYPNNENNAMVKKNLFYFDNCFKLQKAQKKRQREKKERTKEGDGEENLKPDKIKKMNINLNKDIKV